MHLYPAPSTPAGNSTLGLIPDGPAGIAATLKIMGQMVRTNKKDIATVRNTALQLIAPLEQKDYAGEVRALHAYVRDAIRYCHDITDVETVQTPQVTLQCAAGDCDDKAVLLCALLESIGHPTKFVAIGFSPNVYEHVYCETKIGCNWISLETTEPVDAGWAPNPSIVRARMEFFN